MSGSKPNGTTIARRFAASGSRVWLLVLLVLFFVVPLLGGTYLMYLQALGEMKDRELQGDLVRARTLSAMVDQDLRSSENFLISVADRPSLRAEWARRDFRPIKDQLREVRKLEPELLFASVYDADGTLRVIEPSDPIVGRNFAYRDWYRGVTANWEPYVSEVYRTAAGSEPLVVAVAVPIRGDDGKPTGILMATYSLAQLSAKFTSIEKGGWQGFVIVDQHGVVAASPDIRSQSELSRISVSGMVGRALAGSEGSGEVVIDGEKKFVGFAPIPRLGWAALYERPESQALAPALHLKKQDRTISLYLLLIYLATVAFAGILMRHQTRLLAANQALNAELEKHVVEIDRAREELDRFFDLSIDLLCVAGADGYFKRVNPAWEKVLGWSREELISKPYMEFVHPDDRLATSRQADKQKDGFEVLSFENRYLCKDGSYRWLMWNATPALSGNTIFAMARDVTEEKRTREELVRAKEEAERTSRFKDQFLSTMSHELRTPLNAVLGFSDLIRDQRYGSLNERQQRYVRHIHNGGKHLLKLINDILDLSKIEAGRLQLAIENVRLETSFGEAIDTLQPLADQKSQKVVRRVDPTLSVRADGTRLRQVLTNLIGNAIKFTPEGGKIELVAERAGTAARVDVRDSGPGIPPEEQQRIFEAFYRIRHGEKSVEGTGLGLAITTRLVEMHGGRLGVESTPGEGSCFYFTLPIVATMQPADNRVPSGTSRPLSNRILVVEDDPAAAHLIETQLMASGYEVTICDDPLGAVDTAAEIQPSAITMDIIMKPINGWQILPTLKTNPRTKDIPVIVISVVDQPSTGALLGADEYIVKPVDRATLLAAVKRCQERSAGRSPGNSVLVVDDDEAAREFIAEMLSKSGYAVRTAADGAQARINVAESLPDVVLLDLILPGINGFQLLAEWRTHSATEDLRVVVLTSKDLTPDESAYLHNNAEALFHKQEPWLDALLKHLQRTVPSGVLDSP